MIKVLGQISAIIKSPVEPENTDVVWSDSNSSPAILKTYNGSAWIPIAGDSLGMIRVNNSDVSGYIEDKLDESLVVEGLKLKVKNQITSDQIDRINKSTVTYFVDSEIERDSLQPNDGDECFYPKESDPSLFEGWKWDKVNTVWRKFSDQGWANSTVQFSDITDGQESVEDIIVSKIGFAEYGKMLSSTTFGNQTTQVSDVVLNLTSDGFLINLNGTSGSPYYGYTVQNITLNSQNFQNGKILILNNVSANNLYLRSEISSGFGIVNFNKGSKISSDSVFNWVMLGQNEAAMLIKVSNDIWWVTEVFEQKKTAYNKAFGTGVGDIVNISSSISNSFKMAGFSSGGLVPRSTINQRIMGSYSIGSGLIGDGSWHTLTFSEAEIPPIGGIWALLNVATAGAGGTYGGIYIKAYDEPVDRRYSAVYSEAGAHGFGDCWVKVDNLNRISYKIDSSLGGASITLSGFTY